MELEAILKILSDWKKNVEQAIGIGNVYLFGSTINDGGKLFDQNSSDIDLVAMMPDNLHNAVDRTNWLVKLKDFKHALEKSFLEYFNRTNADSAIVSLLPLSRYELSGNIHKSAVRSFFTENIFCDVETRIISVGLISSVEVDLLDDHVRQLFEFAQAIRNKYLGIAVVTPKHKLKWEHDVDIAPKEILRNYSIANHIENPSDPIEMKTDLKMGISYLQHYLHKKRRENDMYKNMQDWLAQRTLQKGTRTPLESHGYLFLSEIIFDVAIGSSSAPLSKNTVENIISSEIDKSRRAIPVEFVIAENGLLMGEEKEILIDIENASINLAWKTEPYFSIRFEEEQLLQSKIQANSRDGKSIDRLRKLTFMYDSLVKGFQYILFFQRPLFRFSKDIRLDILAALRSYIITRYANVFLDSNIGGAREGFLEGYLVNYGELKHNYPGIKMHSQTFNGVIHFGLPDHDLDQYLASNKVLQQKFKNVSYLVLGAAQQPLESINSLLLAKFFVPLLVDRLTRLKIDPLSTDKEVVEFHEEATALYNWEFGLM